MKKATSGSLKNLIKIVFWLILLVLLIFFMLRFSSDLKFSSKILTELFNQRKFQVEKYSYNLNSIENYYAQFRDKNTEPLSIIGDLKKWHKLTFSYNGVSTSETATPNPFLDFRFDMVFYSPSNKVFVVPGFFAADGNSAETSASEGNVWQVHFSPDEIGEWKYLAIYRKGSNISVDEHLISGNSAGFFDGNRGSFSVFDTDKTGNDNRAFGRLDYVGKRYLQYQENKTYFLKGGLDSPENFLAYRDFDNTPNNHNYRKDWEEHVLDWNPGDPYWKSGKGKGIIGAVNYLSRQGLNAIGFLTFNYGGDDKNVFPMLAPPDYSRYDISKLAQWEIVFEHADNKGMFLHFKTQEQENDQFLDGGEIGTERKLYMRELIARFGHHLALGWNLGEEFTQEKDQAIELAAYIHLVDPYNHHIDMHTFVDEQELRYKPMLGTLSKLSGVSLQAEMADVNKNTRKWIKKSEESGKAWVVTNDEQQGGGNLGVLPDDMDPDHDDIRYYSLWGNLLAGGAGVELYYGWDNSLCSDLSCDNHRLRENMWKQVSVALEIVGGYSFWEMNPCELVDNNSENLCYGKENEFYLIYVKRGGTIRFNRQIDNFSISVVDPKTGQPLYFISKDHSLILDSRDALIILNSNPLQSIIM